jgi:hypothetical protein
MRETTLIRKIQNLPAEAVSEVEDFVDFLTERRKIRTQPPEKFFENENLSLQEIGFNEEEIVEQRAALASFAQDWELPEMEIYDEL